jgi:hypothetical protein
VAMGHSQPRLLPRLLLLVLLASLLLAVARAAELDCLAINAEGTDQRLRFQQYTPREEVSRFLLQRAMAEVRRAMKDVSSVDFEIRGEDLKEKVSCVHLIGVWSD